MSAVAVDPTAPATSASAAPAPPPPVEVVAGRTILGSPAPQNIATSIEPLPADRAALLVAQGADDREGFVRWIDAAGQMGPVIRLVDEYVVTAYQRGDGKRDLVTSDGDHLCISRYAPDRAQSEARICETIEAKTVVAAGGKLAVIALEEHKIKVEKSVVTYPPRKPKPTTSPAQPKKPPSKTPRPKKPAQTKKKPPAPKKKTYNQKPKIEKVIEYVRTDVEVLVQWATSDGFGETKNSGLKFLPPLAGMSIVDAKSTPRGVLIGFFEKAKPSPNAPKVINKSPPGLGWAALQTGLVNEQGVFDPASKKLVLEGECDWGFLRGFASPRFIDTSHGPALLTQKTPRGGACELTKVDTTLALVVPAPLCAVDPGAVMTNDMNVWEPLLRMGPKRRPGQPKYDPELVAWAGDTAYFVTNEGQTLQSAKPDGSTRELPAPFAARRVRMTYAESAFDGSGQAVVDGQTYRLNAAGEVRLEEQATKLDPRTNVDAENRWVVPLPDGGRWHINAGRTRVVWTNHEGQVKADVPWPEGQSDAVCRDGLPGKKFVPSLVPGEFVNVPALAAPGICVVGHPFWASDGSLRWFGTFAQGMDVLPEVRVLKGLGKTIATLDSSHSGPGETSKSLCPSEMVLVDGKLCVDRFEGTIVDVETGSSMAPDFPVTPNLFDIAIGDWVTARSRVGSVFARSMPLPFVPEWQRGKKIDVRAVPLAHARPNGYLTGLVAESACSAAGKRLCTLDEFVLACRGEADTQFPYGDTYVDGVCNVNREVHPAALLHDNASVGHLDPRLNRVRVGGTTLLRETGGSPQCRSRWGKDAIYDMVGNLDEWVDEGSGAFAGGFYARSTRAGCDAVITAHPKNYLDYSTGVRCCKDATK